MSDYRDGPADVPAYRHRTVYRTVRGLALSGSREGAAGSSSADARPPVRVSEIYQARRAISRVAPDRVQDDATGVFDAVRYSEPND